MRTCVAYESIVWLTSSLQFFLYIDLVTIKLIHVDTISRCFANVEF